MAPKLLIIEKKLMQHHNNDFNSLVDTIYKLPLDEKQELKHLLDHNIADVRREEIARNFRAAQVELKSGKLRFSSSIKDLKKML